LQTDSMRFDGDVNFYRYVMNSPGNLQDPFGLYSWHDFWEWLKAMAHIIVPGHESVEAARTLPAIVRIANEQKAQEEWVQCMNNPPPEDCDCSKAFDHLNEVKNQTDN